MPVVATERSLPALPRVSRRTRLLRQLLARLGHDKFFMIALMSAARTLAAGRLRRSALHAQVSSFLRKGAPLVVKARH